MRFLLLLSVDFVLFACVPTLRDATGRRAPGVVLVVLLLVGNDDIAALFIADKSSDGSEVSTNRQK